MLFSYYFLLQMQYPHRKSEIDEQGNGIHDGGDERARHNCGVKSDLLSDKGKRAADELGGNYRDNKRHADREDNEQGLSI